MKLFVIDILKVGGYQPGIVIFILKNFSFFIPEGNCLPGSFGLKSHLVFSSAK